MTITHCGCAWCEGAMTASGSATASLRHNESPDKFLLPAPLSPQWPGINIWGRAPHFTQFVENLDIMKFLVGLFFEGKKSLVLRHFSDIFSL